MFHSRSTVFSISGCITLITGAISVNIRSERRTAVWPRAPPDLAVRPGLYIDLEAEIDFRNRNTIPNAPILGTAFAQEHFNAVRRNLKLSEISDKGPVQSALRFERATGKKVDVDKCVAVSAARRYSKSMGH